MCCSLQPVLDQRSEVVAAGPCPLQPLGHRTVLLPPPASGGPRCPLARGRTLPVSARPHIASYVLAVSLLVRTLVVGFRAHLDDHLKIRDGDICQVPLTK